MWRNIFSPFLTKSIDHDFHTIYFEPSTHEPDKYLFVDYINNPILNKFIDHAKHTDAITISELDTVT